MNKKLWKWRNASEPKQKWEIYMAVECTSIKYLFLFIMLNDDMAGSHRGEMESRRSRNTTVTWCRKIYCENMNYEQEKQGKRKASHEGAGPEREEFSLEFIPVYIKTYPLYCYYISCPTTIHPPFSLSNFRQLLIHLFLFHDAKFHFMLFKHRERFKGQRDSQVWKENASFFLPGAKCIWNAEARELFINFLRGFHNRFSSSSFSSFSLNEKINETSSLSFFFSPLHDRLFISLFPHFLCNAISPEAT